MRDFEDVEIIGMLKSYVRKSLQGGNTTIVKNTNLLSIPDGEYSQYGLSVKIKDNIITLDANTGLSQQVYIKLTNGVELAQGSAPSSWRQETVSFLETGKTYGYRNFVLGGISNRHGIIGTCRSSSGTTILGHSKPLETLAENVAYIQLYIPKGAECENFQFGIEISADAIPTDWEGTIIANKDYFKQYVAETAIATEHFIDVDFSLLGLSSAYTQGMCSDGTYLYVATINPQDDTANTLVCKYALSDGSLIAQECSYSLGHCNSMTYNPNTGKIYCVALDNVGTIHTINTDLTYDSSFTISLSDVYSGYSGIGAISYNSVQNKYVCLMRGDRKGYAIFDANFNLLEIVWAKTFAFSYRSSTYGSIFADKDYIYQVIGLSPTAVAVYGWNGKYIGEMMLPSATDSIELEDMEIIGDYVYLNVSQTQGQSVYVIKLLAEYTRWGDLLKV